MFRAPTTLIVLVTVCLPSIANADIEWLIPMPPTYTRAERFMRAGYPNQVSRWAKVFPNYRYSGYYVGGGAALRSKTCQPNLLKGVSRRAHEGTFGLDYVPPWSRVRLNWFHGKRFQDGEGQYEQDKKNRPLSNPFDIRPLPAEHHGGHDGHSGSHGASHGGSSSGHGSHNGHGAGHSNSPGGHSGSQPSHSSAGGQGSHGGSSTTNQSHGPAAGSGGH